MTPRRMVIIGDGGHAASVSDAAAGQGFDVVQLVDVSSADGSFDSLIMKLGQLDVAEISLGLGLGINFVRRQAYNSILMKFPTTHFPPIVHPTASVSPSAHMGPGSVALAHSHIGAQSHVSPGAVLGVGASVDHGSSLGEFVSLGPGARIAGDVSIGRRTVIGLQAGILQGRTVGEDSVVGAQSLVIEDIPSLSIAVGSPCRVIRAREWDERYY